MSTTILKIVNDRKNGLNIIGAIFNLETPKQKIIGTRLPTSKYSLNLIELRADFYVKGDKKELICGSLLRVCTDQISVTERRVPTALLWSIIAEYGSCILVDESLAVKEYLENGMSSKLKLLKVQNPLSMLLLNRKLLISPTYKSKLYRLKASVQYVRYSFLSRKIPTIMHMRGISIPLGSLLALLDLLYLFSFLIKKSQTFNINKFRN